MRECKLNPRQQLAHFEHQWDLVQGALEQRQQHEKRDAEEADAERIALDAAIAAARRHDEERQRRKLAARAAAEQVANEQRRAIEEGYRRREVRRDEALRQQTRDAWEHYEMRWRAFNAQDNNLSFASIPWPMESQPRSLTDISVDAIKRFVLSPHPFC